MINIQFFYMASQTDFCLYKTGTEFLDINNLDWHVKGLIPDRMQRCLLTSRLENHLRLHGHAVLGDLRWSHAAQVGEFLAPAHLAATRGKGVRLAVRVLTGLQVLRLLPIRLLEAAPLVGVPPGGPLRVGGGWSGGGGRVVGEGDPVGQAWLFWGRGISCLAEGQEAVGVTETCRGTKDGMIVNLKRYLVQIYRYIQLDGNFLTFDLITFIAKNLIVKNPGSPHGSPWTIFLT